MQPAGCRVDVAVAERLRGLVSLSLGADIRRRGQGGQHAAAAVIPAQVSAAPTPSCFGKHATIVGSGLINGTSGDDVIVGSDGADVVNAGDGNDRVCGLEGDDSLRGELGDDRIDAGPAMTAPSATWARSRAI
jgi:Ca2+-binding RTX toxin-like protein